MHSTDEFLISFSVNNIKKVNPLDNTNTGYPQMNRKCFDSDTNIVCISKY